MTKEEALREINSAAIGEEYRQHAILRVDVFGPEDAVAYVREWEKRERTLQSLHRGVGTLRELRDLLEPLAGSKTQ